MSALVTGADVPALDDDGMHLVVAQAVGEVADLFGKPTTDAVVDGTGEGQEVSGVSIVGLEPLQREAERAVESVQPDESGPVGLQESFFWVRSLCC